MTHTYDLLTELTFEQLIFRKVADVKREQELAERRKQDPQPQDLAQDHLVRKIFSKFRKPSDAGTAFISRQPTTLATQLQKSALSDLELGSKDPDGAKSKSDSESEPKPKVKGTSKWAASLTGPSAGTVAVPATTTITSKDTAEADKEDAADAGSRRTELVCRKSEHIHVVKDIRPPTQGNKWPKVPSSSRPETIEESTEPATAETAVAPVDSASSRPRASITSIIQTKGITSTDYQQLIATLIDLRVDLKLEMQKLTSRVNKIDQHVEELSRKLDPSPYLGSSEETKVKKVHPTKASTSKKSPVAPSPSSSSFSRTHTIPKTVTSDEVRAMLETEIVEQEGSEDDQDLTSKL